MNPRVSVCALPQPERESHLACSGNLTAAATGQPATRPEASLVVGPGWLGHAIATSLQARGDSVWTMRRETPRTEHALADEAVAQRSIRLLQGDIAGSPASWDAMLRDGPTSVDHVILCVAPSRARGDTHASIYPAAARGALRLASMMGARTVTYTSSTSVYGAGDGAVVHEGTAVSDADERVRALVEAEHAILHGAADTPGGKAVQRIVLRVAGLYGPGRDPADRFRTLSAHGDGARWCNFAWQSDVSAAVRHLQAHSAASGDASVYNCADGNPVQARDITTWLFRGSDHRTEPGLPRAPRSNQRVATDKLRATGWTPSVQNVFDGLTILGHAGTPR